jgi:hypothetical protein
VGKIDSLSKRQEVSIKKESKKEVLKTHALSLAEGVAVPAPSSGAGTAAFFNIPMLKENSTLDQRRILFLTLSID